MDTSVYDNSTFGTITEINTNSFWYLACEICKIKQNKLK